MQGSSGTPRDLAKSVIIWELTIVKYLLWFFLFLNRPYQRGQTFAFNRLHVFTFDTSRDMKLDAATAVQIIEGYASAKESKVASCNKHIMQNKRLIIMNITHSAHHRRRLAGPDRSHLRWIQDSAVSGLSPPEGVG